MTTQKDWRLRNVIRSVTFISGDSSFPCQIGVSPRCNNLRRNEIKEESTKPTTSVREFTSNNWHSTKPELSFTNCLSRCSCAKWYHKNQNWYPSYLLCANLLVVYGTEKSLRFSGFFQFWLKRSLKIKYWWRAAEPYTVPDGGKVSLRSKRNSMEWNSPAASFQGVGKDNQ